jgi:hypothetical protein
LNPVRFSNVAAVDRHIEVNAYEYCLSRSVDLIDAVDHSDIPSFDRTRQTPIYID